MSSLGLLEAKNKNKVKKMFLFDQVKNLFAHFRAPKEKKKKLISNFLLVFEILGRYEYLQIFRKKY